MRKKKNYDQYKLIYNHSLLNWNNSFDKRDIKKRLKIFEIYITKIKNWQIKVILHIFDWFFTKTKKQKGLI